MQSFNDRHAIAEPSSRLTAEFEMNTIKAFTALGLAVASPALSHARQPEVRSFLNSPSLFSLIEPGFSPAKTADAVYVDEAGDIRKLDHGLASRANEPSFKQTATIVDNLT